MKSVNFIAPLGVIIAMVATGYQLAVVGLQPVLSTRQKQRSLAAIFRSIALITVSLFVVLLPKHTNGTILQINLILQVGLFLLIAATPGYELLVYIHDANGEQESLIALEQEGRLLVLSICGMVMIVIAKLLNWFMDFTDPSALDREIKDISTTGDDSGSDQDLHKGTNGRVRLPRKDSKPSVWDDVIDIGISDLQEFLNSPDWNLRSEEDEEIKVWRKSEPLIEGGAPPIKVAGVVRGVDPFTLCTCFQSSEFKRAASETISKLKVVEEINENTKIYYQQDKYPWPMCNREALFLSSTKEFPGQQSMVLAEWSIPNHPAADLSENNKMVRVQTYNIVQFSSFGDGSDSLVTMAANIDVGGSIPLFVVEEEVRKLPTLFNEVKKVIDSDQGKETFKTVKSTINKALWTEIVHQELTKLRRNFLKHNCPEYEQLMQYVAPIAKDNHTD